MSLITNTEYKLQEAKFFLDKLESHKPFFDFYLSAFLNASRSVTWVMRNEYGQKENWVLWFEKSEIEDDEKSLLKDINDFRIQTTKRNGIKTEFFLFENFVAGMKSYQEIEKMQTDLDGEEVKITITEATDESPKLEEGKYVIQGKVNMERSKTQKSREEFVELCKQYYDFLNKKVDYCTKTFYNKEIEL